MAKYAIKSARKMTTACGDVKYGDVLAVIESDLNPTDIAAWLTYNLAQVRPLDESDKLVTKEEIAEDREQPQPEPVDELPFDDELVDESPLPEIVQDSSDDESEGDHWAAALKLDAGIVNALDEAKIDSIDELRLIIDSDEKIKGIGDLREKQIREALAKLDK